MKYSNSQLFWLVALRVFIGWHFLHEGVVKLANPNWSSIGYLMDSQGIMKNFFYSLAANPTALSVIDFLNVWGLIGIGLGLIIGIFTNISVVSGIILLALYYFSHPPIVGIKYSLPMEGSYLFVNKNLIEMAALIVLLVFPTGRHIGLDRLIFSSKNKNRNH